MEKDARKDEKEFSPNRLLGYFVEKDAKFKTKRHECEGIN